MCIDYCNIQLTQDLGRQFHPEKGMREDADSDGARPWKLLHLIHDVNE